MANSSECAHEKPLTAVVSPEPWITGLSFPVTASNGIDVGHPYSYQLAWSEHAYPHLVSIVTVSDECSGMSFLSHVLSPASM